MFQPAALQVPPAFRVPAVARLLGLGPGADTAQARRFIDDAPSSGVDLDLMWAWGIAPEPGVAPPKSAALIEHVALVVPGAGRVGMVFASPPRPKVRGEADTAPGLVAAIGAACTGAALARDGGLALVQALAEPHQAWLKRALVDAGFISVGRLLYLRRLNDPPPGARPALDSPWPGGVRIVTASQLGPEREQDRVIGACLDRTYEGTLDCPGLFGLRQTRDILASHRACGHHDPDLWWIAIKDAQAVACALFNPYPDQGSIELVYLGLAPEVRGLGLARRMMELALHTLARMKMQRVACAVDERNAPARRLYDRLGFSRFDTREAFVRRTEPQ